MAEHSFTDQGTQVVAPALARLRPAFRLARLRSLSFQRADLQPLAAQRFGVSRPAAIQACSHCSHTHTSSVSASSLILEVAITKEYPHRCESIFFSGRDRVDLLICRCRSLSTNVVKLLISRHTRHIRESTNCTYPQVKCEH